MAGQPTLRAVALPPEAADTSPALPLRAAPRREHTEALATSLFRRLTWTLPPIHLVSAAITYVFVVYVVPLPGKVPSTHWRRTVLIATIAMTALAWLVSQLWGVHTGAPMRRWLKRGGEPTDEERARTVRLPVYQASHSFAVWSACAVGLGALAVAIGSSVGAGVLITMMVFAGGLLTSALSYFASEWINRPAVALALQSDPPVRPLLPGIGARIYLAWEFGTALAVGGSTVIAITYLAGGGLSPRRMADTVIFLGGVTLTLGLAALLVAIRSVATPVRTMRGAMARVEAGDTEVSVPVNDGGEVGLLQAGFNGMVAGLRERDLVRDLFGRQVGEEVARSALRRGLELGGELREAAVLFADVVGSTAFAATTDPHEVVQTLNRFFAIVVEVVTLHGGWVNKFEGDAALCVFGAPTEHPDAAGAALAAGRELRRRLNRELDGLRAAIGLSAGKVVSGNIGAAKRFEYTVIGDPVNEASRLTELAKEKPSRLVASEAILRRAGEREVERWRLEEPVVLRGRSEATRTAVPA